MKRLFFGIYLGIFVVFLSIPARAQYSGDAWLQILGTKEVRDAMGRQSVYLGVTNTIEPGSIFIRNKNTLALSFRASTAFQNINNYIIRGNQTAEHGNADNEKNINPALLLNLGIFNINLNASAQIKNATKVNVTEAKWAIDRIETDNFLTAVQKATPGSDQGNYLAALTKPNRILLLNALHLTSLKVHIEYSAGSGSKAGIQLDGIKGVTANAQYEFKKVSDTAVDIEIKGDVYPLGGYVHVAKDLSVRALGKPYALVPKAVSVSFNALVQAPKAESTIDALERGDPSLSPRKAVDKVAVDEHKLDDIYATGLRAPISDEEKKAVALGAITIGKHYAGRGISRSHGIDQVNRFLDVLGTPHTIDGKPTKYCACGVAYALCQAYCVTKSLDPYDDKAVAHFKQVVPMIGESMARLNPRCRDMVRTAIDRHTWVPVESKIAPKPGWLVFYCWDNVSWPDERSSRGIIEAPRRNGKRLRLPEHVGIVIQAESNGLHTVEFNTSSKDSSNGGAVAEQKAAKRPYRYVIGYIRTYP